MRLLLAIPRVGKDAVSASGFTIALNSGEVLFSIEEEPGPDSIEYFITLPIEGFDTVDLHWFGHVLRCSRIDGSVEAAEAPGYKVIATLERYEFVRK